MGVLIAIFILLFWLLHLLYALIYLEANFLSFGTYLHLLIQTYLYTGLFITAHDSMHGTVAKNRTVNNLIGRIATNAFAFLSYKNLTKKHYLHHRFPATEQDPDFSPNSNHLFVWWFVFMKNYLSWLQMLLMAITFNVLLIWFSTVQVILFWVIPAIFSTFQLFYFGTFLPHRRPFNSQMNPHNSRTQKRNHFWAMLSCYFFGYHWEHHETPTIPWWKLYQTKNK